MVVPTVGGVTTEAYAQQGTDEEPNDEDSPYSNATEVNSLSEIENDAIGDDGEADVYAFTLNAGAQVELSQGIGGSAYPVTLLDENGTVLGRIADQDIYRGEENPIRANASGTGTYYLKIDGEPGAEYSISKSVIEPDANEPNDDRDDATAIDLGEREQGTLVRGDIDYYAVELDAGDETSVFTNATAAATVIVYGSNGEELGLAPAPAPGGVRESEEGLTPVVNTTAAEDGTYYLEVARSPNAIGNTNGQYNLTVVDASPAGGAPTTTAGGEETTAGEPGEETDTTVDSTTGPDSSGRTDRTTERPETTESGAEEPSGTDIDATTDVGTETTDGTMSAGSEASARSRTSTASETTGAPAGGSTDGETEATGGGVDDVDENVEETAVNGPGFDVVAALLALLGAALLATQRS